jgi:hypothetical protein
MVLGTAHLNTKRYTLEIRHSIRQEVYLRYKAGLLEQLQKSAIQVIPLKYRKNGQNSGGGYPGVRIETRKHALYRRLYKLFYSPTDKKRVTHQGLDYLDPRGIAIWYMDNGAVSAKRRQGKIHACELVLNTHFSRLENELIIQYFAEVWGLQFGLNLNKSRWRLRMGTQQARKLADLIAPYVIPAMRYKIDPLLV